MSQYRVLTAGTLDAGTGFQRPRQNLPQQVSLDSPAMDVMTDLSLVSAETVSPNASVDDAEEKMIASGVRLLFVTSPLNQVIGIVTSKDLGGENILRFINDTNTPRKDLIVRDIMTPQHKIDVLEMGDVATSRVGDLVATLKRMGRQHALVVDRSGQGQQTIRGLLSTSQIGRQLGISIDTTDVAGSLADLARAG
ncbi:MAG: CBS domain-containing protein [Chromatiaceae bacterium]|nr:CBS domain-containing protein [Chromatiaceae bacterium]MCP5422247.1 CBS domain-containing protein [Chromatiaceae bacterium]